MPLEEEVEDEENLDGPQAWPIDTSMEEPQGNEDELLANAEEEAERIMNEEYHEQEVEDVEDLRPRLVRSLADEEIEGEEILISTAVSVDEDEALPLGGVQDLKIEDE